MTPPMTLTLHPLVVAVGRKLGPSTVQAKLAPKRKGQPAPQVVQPHLVPDDFDTVAYKTGAAEDFGAAASSHELRSFAGYLGGSWRKIHDWQILFTDSNLRNWIMVKRGDIVAHDRAHDEKAAYGLRDYIWVVADAEVGRGGFSISPETLILSGDFTRAADFAPSMRGDTYSSGNLLDEATTPGCCTANSHHYP